MNWVGTARDSPPTWDVVGRTCRSSRLNVSWLLCLGLMMTTLLLTMYGLGKPVPIVLMTLGKHWASGCAPWSFSLMVLLSC